MTYFILPSVYIDIYKHIEYISSENEPKPIILNSLYTFLNEIKCKIDICDKKCLMAEVGPR